MAGANQEVHHLMRLIVSALICVVLAGCLAPSQPIPASIYVRDADTGQPVQDAVVRSTGGNVFIPPRDVLGPPVSPPATPAGARGTTGPLGLVKLSLAGNRPNDVEVTAEGYAPLHITLRANQNSISNAGIWMHGLLPPAGAPPSRRLQLKVTTVSVP